MSNFGERVRVLQWIDRRLGVPLCFVLTIWRRLVDWFASAKSPIPIKSIVFLKLAEQGSTVLAHDAIRRAVEKAGRHNVYFFVFDSNRFVVDLLQLIPPENVLAINTRSAWTMMISAYRQMIFLRRRGVAACIDMEFFTRVSAALSWFTGAPTRVGFHTFYGEGPYRGDLMTHRIIYNPHLHAARGFTSLVQALERDPTEFPTFPVVPPESQAVTRFEPTADERQEASDILQKVGIGTNSRLILLNANASDLLPLRKWPAERYVELARRLLAVFPDAAIAFTGAPSETAAIQGLVDLVASPRCVCLAGRTTLRQLLVIYCLSEILVTNDSGPAHFASMTSVDIVALFGPETPSLFAALGPRSHPIWLGLACSPCVNAYNNRQTACRDNQCMKQIDLDLVFETVVKIGHDRGLRTKDELVNAVV